MRPLSNTQTMTSRLYCMHFTKTDLYARASKTTFGLSSKTIDGMKLTLASISDRRCQKELHPLYVLKAHNLTQTIVNGEAAETQHLCPLARKTAEICNKLKQTTTKNNIMKEAKEIFYDSCFLEKLIQTSI